MTPEALAALHARCFTDAPPPWSAGSFEALATHAGTRLYCRAAGFALARVIGPEAELLTIAVDPDARRRGHGGALLTEMAEALAAERVEEIFLEVAATNTAARALYAAQGYVERGRRPGYYRRRTAPPIDALVLVKTLRRTPGRG